MRRRIRKARYLFDRAALAAGARRSDEPAPQPLGAPWFLIVAGVALAAWIVHEIAGALTARGRFNRLVQAAEASGQVDELIKREPGGPRGFEEAAGDALNKLVLAGILFGGVSLLLRKQARRAEV